MACLIIGLMTGLRLLLLFHCKSNLKPTSLSLHVEAISNLGQAGPFASCPKLVGPITDGKLKCTKPHGGDSTLSSGTARCVQCFTGKSLMPNEVLRAADADNAYM
ncbi:hypothetical protein B0H15DRAFT_854459 [Mycena belliarum]|uniref:Secreted protein n=1 Tax=Mycena belliarum TaxID=1033014 RepID=A0AAD6U1K5_9AGAR|nr:hypothetical protein B0H15DRAFT_854459 [Mycena belliae]